MKLPLWTTSCQHLWGPLAKVGSSAKFGVVVFKASILDSLVGGPSAKVGSSAKFGVVVFKASMLDSLGGPLAKVGSSAKFGVVVCKSSIFNSLGGGSISQSRFICQVLCSGMQGIYSRFTGGPSVKEGSSANYEHTSKFTLASHRSFLRKTNEPNPEVNESLNLDETLNFTKKHYRDRSFNHAIFRCTSCYTSHVDPGGLRPLKYWCRILCSCFKYPA